MGLKVRGISHDISKAFNKVWRQNSICSEIINVLEDFLSCRKKRRFKWSMFILG